ncbi:MULTISPECIES: helix-turn-helix domain-containing protein [Haloferax]|jgi:predicted DNA binding protein|uniref:Transcriptional regulator n=4 Tax=Haloferax TaxID=2251 RepID=A0A6C0UWU7_HALVO|nr:MULTISPECIES: helix-turn-helix domain-containing protein [Haloferax]ELK54289.1 transcriptional regulator [Haloferax sp. BAB-2207]ELZ79142.1 transcriptional regulator [Haloferax lucentense DSM 14919]ELZ86218.1 transcriptional regulator [Haloferax alexandrinus JCM 10717]MBC9987574.1 transcriptional regulator [Haloferax sp. AS1]NLV04509.1 transcriptional regulator [Haloferax alexandrinus]
MREFEFVVRFSEGTDELMDLFYEYPSLRSRSSVCSSTTDVMWRVDHVVGTPEALSAFEEVFLDETRCNECLDAPDCHTHRNYHVLDRSDNSMTVYTYREEVSNCHSIPRYVLEHVGPGVIFESSRRAGAYRWRILYPGDHPLGELYETIEAQLREGLQLDVEHLTSAGNWDAESRIAADLSSAHWEALETAVEHGYYERPRKVTVEDLSDVLDVPRSTVQYRLRTAEDLVMSQLGDPDL